MLQQLELVVCFCFFLNFKTEFCILLKHLHMLSLDYTKCSTLMYIKWVDLEIRLINDGIK